MDNKNTFKEFLSTPWLKYSIAIVVLYGALLIIRFTYSSLINFQVFSWFKSIYPEFMTGDDVLFNRSFVEWFGVMYGLLLPLILVKAWDQYESVEKEFDKELDTIRTFHEDVLFLQGGHDKHKRDILKLLLDYTNHVKDNYRQETSSISIRKDGNNILSTLRRKLRFLFNLKESKDIPTPLIEQLLNQLNLLIDIRGDRISLSTQRFFTKYIRGVAIMASFVWLIPFYFTDYILGIFGDMLVFSLSLLIIIILHIIEDLDEPFYREWKLEKEAWHNLSIEIENSIQGANKRRVV